MKELYLIQIITNYCAPTGSFILSTSGSNIMSAEAFRGHGSLTAEQEEIRCLKAENKRLKMEKEILKKATAFFAGETK